MGRGFAETHQKMVGVMGFAALYPSYVPTHHIDTFHNSAISSKYSP